MYKIKICGITTADILPVINELKPDYVGFIMTAGFSRSVSDDFVRRCGGALDSRIARVGVFVNDDVSRIAALVGSGVIDVVQLHGDEDGSYIRRLKSLVPVTVIKAVGVSDGRAAAYPAECDIVLLDSCTATSRGGTGKSIFWRRYDELDKPVILAGGITAENVKAALAAVRPWGVDTSGGVETDGVKDAAKIYKYITNIRECDKNE